MKFVSLAAYAEATSSHPPSSLRTSLQLQDLGGVLSHSNTVALLSLQFQPIDSQSKHSASRSQDVWGTLWFYQGFLRREVAIL
jgi:hypothetical protein